MSYRLLTQIGDDA